MEGSIFSTPNFNFCGCCFCFRVIGNYELLATITTIFNFYYGKIYLPKYDSLGRKFFQRYSEFGFFQLMPAPDDNIVLKGSY